MTESNTAAESLRQISVNKIYVKDLSFESPGSPQVFTEQFTPETEINLQTTNTDLGNNNVEVVLTITVTAKKGDTTLFLIELAQAGVFTLFNLEDPEDRGRAVGSFCPNVLFPYAREAISSIVGKGGFPDLLLQPIDFDALYMQSRAERTAVAN
ncbi:MAG: protein-export chaperone SecB [Pseudomonadota bacterium]